MALYFYFNETTGDLVYSDQATYSGSGYTSLGQQTNTNPTMSGSWVFNSQRASIKTVTKDPNISKQIDVLETMRYMFYNCEALTSLDLSGFDTSHVSNMYRIFSGCSSLISLDLSGFDTSNVTGMAYMFGGCGALTSLDLSSFDTSNVTTISSMFSDCSALTSLDLSSFDTSNVTSMAYMFGGCDALTSLDLSGFNTSNVGNMEGVFNKCSALTSLDLSSFDTSNVTNMGYMFSGCGALTSLDLSSFDTSNVTNMGYMFSGCNSLRIIDISPNMSNLLSQLPATTYYDAVTRQSYAKADIPGGSTYVRYLADLDLMATMVQTRMGINVAQRLAQKALKTIGSATARMSSGNVARASSDNTDYDGNTLELVTDSTGKVTEVHFVGA